MDHQTFAQLLGNYGEFVGAIAVVVTLVYLSVQVKTNSTMIKATIREQRTAGSNAVTFEWMRHAGIFSKVASGDTLGVEDSFRISLAHQAMFREWETYAYQRHIGVLDDSEWNAILTNFRTVLEFPGTIDHWRLSKEMYSTHLVTVIDELLQSPAIVAPPISWPDQQ
jgi:hypothetical protein